MMTTPWQPVPDVVRAPGGAQEVVSLGDGPAILFVHGDLFAHWFLPVAADPALDADPAADPDGVAVDGPGPSLLFQRGESPVRPGRLHLDIVGDIRAAEVLRLQALGATVRDVHHHHTVMLDPEGNRFCVQDPHG